MHYHYYVLECLISDQLVTCVCVSNRQKYREERLFLGSDDQCDRKHIIIRVDCGLRGLEWSHCNQ